MKKIIQTSIYTTILLLPLFAYAEVDVYEKKKGYTFYGENFSVYTRHANNDDFDTKMAVDIFERPQRLETNTYTIGIPSFEWVILKEEQLENVRKEIEASLSMKSEMQRSFAMPVAGYINTETGDYFLIKHSPRYFDNYEQIEKEFQGATTEKLKDVVDKKVSKDADLTVNSVSKIAVDRNKNRIITDADTIVAGNRVISRNVMFFGNSQTVSVSFYATNKEMSGDFQTIIDEFKWREGQIFTERKSKRNDTYETFFINGFVGAITVAILSFFVRRKKK